MSLAAFDSLGDRQDDGRVMAVRRTSPTAMMRAGHAVAAATLSTALVHAGLATTEPLAEGPSDTAHIELVLVMRAAAGPGDIWLRRVGHAGLAIA